MKVIALCPTYKRLKTLRFSLWQFLQQKVDVPAYFLFYDESGDITGIASEVNDRVFGLYKKENHLTLPEKYRRLVKLSYDLFGKSDENIYVIWDDDDVYLPHHIASHVMALKQNIWSKPSCVWSYYGNKIFLENNTHGRFHCSLAFRREVFDKCFWTSEGDAWDLDHIANVENIFGRPGDTIDEHRFPSFCYIWNGRQWHYSWFCGKGNSWEQIKAKNIESEGQGILFPDESVKCSTRDTYYILLNEYHRDYKKHGSLNTSSTIKIEPVST